MELLTSKDGEVKAIEIPDEFWDKVHTNGTASFDEISEALEDYCMKKADEEGEKSPFDKSK